jgi:hypothetical protein
MGERQEGQMKSTFSATKNVQLAMVDLLASG